MKRVLMVVLCSCYYWAAEAQSDPVILESIPNNTINIGLLGDASIVSISYERLFHIRPNHFLTGKAGIGFNQEDDFCILPNISPCDNVVRNFLTIPHHVTSNYGRGKHFGEIGLGGTLLTGNAGPFYMIYPIVGYRYTHEGGFDLFSNICHATVCSKPECRHLDWSHRFEPGWDFLISCYSNTAHSWFYYLAGFV